MRNLVLPLLMSVGYLVGCGSNTVTSTGTTGAAASSTTGGTTAAATTGSVNAGNGTTGSGSTTGAGTTGTSTTGEATTTGGGSAGAYPAGPYGVTVNRILQNFTFPGYLSNEAMVAVNTLPYNANLTLQDFRNALDSSGQPFRYLLLDISAGWCNPCNAEAEDLGLNTDAADKNKIAGWLAKGGLMLTVLVEGYNESTGAPPVPGATGDIATWTNQHTSQCSMGTDPDQVLLAQGISPSAFPTNLVIDLKTMKIVSAWYGIDTTYAKWEAALNAP